MVMASSPPTPVHIAKAQLSRLIERALAGEDVVISRGSKPMVRLVPVGGPAVRSPGRYAALIGDCATIDEPLPPEELARWSGE